MPQERTLDSNSGLAFRLSLVRERLCEFKAITASEEAAEKLTFELCREDLTFYFLEQFTKSKLVRFGYHFIEGKDGTEMVSGGYELLGDVCAIYEKAVLERERGGLDADREKAELEGFEDIKHRLIESIESGEVTLVVLVSPPPTEAEKTTRPGFADYSFVYFGLFDPETKNVDMYALRNNMGLDEQTNFVNNYSGEIVISVEALPNDFLRNPIFKFGEEALKAHRQFLANTGGVGEFAKYRPAVDKAARVLVDALKNGADDERLNMMLAEIELEFVKMAKAPFLAKPELVLKVDRFMDTRAAYGYLAKKYFEVDRQFGLASFQGGSCGSSMLSQFGGENISIFNVSAVPDLVLSFLRRQESFSCPRCQGEIPSGFGITTCPHCGYTKEQAAKDSGKKCD